MKAEKAEKYVTKSTTEDVFLLDGWTLDLFHS